MTAGGGRRPKVLHVTTADVSLEMLLRPQLEAFQAAGYEVVTASAPGPYVPALEAAGLRHVALENSTRSMDLRRDAAVVGELFRLFRREKPDIAHLHNPKPGWYGRVAARLAGVDAVVNTVHGLYATSDDPWAKRAVVHTLERLASTCSHAELVQNPEDLETLARLRVPRSKLALLANGIDLERFSPPDPDRRRRSRMALGLDDGEVAVGVVCRLVWEKGIQEVIDAAEHISGLADDVTILVAGPLDPDKADGLGEEDLAQISAETGIRFLGEVSDIENFYDALDIYVLASHREGFPRSAMEAAAMGVPVIATDIRGCREVVDHDRTGLLFPVRDSAALTDAIMALARDRERRMAMGRAGIDKARRSFDQQSVIDLTLRTYERLLGRGPDS